MNRGKKLLAGLTALVLLLLVCAAAAADGRPGVYDITFNSFEFDTNLVTFLNEFRFNNIHLRRT